MVLAESMSTGTQTCDIVIPGYTLTDRIGAGGYAEVWRAEAPGGIQKAVKVVYGYYDDEFASQELKALERIKGVRHPFLLSLERFEVVSGRLAILTELADMSLDQRLRQCRAEGHTGIPREELLQYMADAAEALDFLSQRHSLMHLDIKPENLLILGDHIKVADFGLVKELATRTQNSRLGFEVDFFESVMCVTGADRSGFRVRQFPRGLAGARLLRTARP